MSHYQVQFRSSGIVAFSASERAICQHWLECNDYGPDKPIVDPETSGSEREVKGYARGDCLNLFVLKKVKTS